MSIDDHGKATEYLARLGYYRLSAYWYPFRQPGAGGMGDNFKPGTTFKSVLDLYSFDKKLRLQLLDVLERIEMFVRTAVALKMGSYDPLGHRLPNLLDRKFTSKNPRTGVVPHTEWLARLDEKARTSKEEFADHFRQKYPTSFMPIWIAVELLDFGPLSHFFSGMKYADRRDIALGCGAPDPNDLATWVRALSVVRNTCAHHARLFNRPLIDQPSLPKLGTIPLLDHVANAPYSNRRIYAACAIARFLLLTVNPRTQWSTRLKEHLATFPTNHISPKVMGFPDNWEALPLWN